MTVTHVPFAAIPKVVSDAARLVMKGELVVSGAAALAYWVPAGQPGPEVRFVELAADTTPALQQLSRMMGPGAWYQQQLGFHVVAHLIEDFEAPPDWRAQARRLTLPEAPKVAVVVPRPADIVLAKTERLDPQDLPQIRQCLQFAPMTDAELDTLAWSMPQAAPTFEEPARRARFLLNVERVRGIIQALAAPPLY